MNRAAEALTRRAANQRRVRMDTDRWSEKMASQTYRSMVVGKVPVLKIDPKNFDHLVDTANLVLASPCDNNARELAEIFLHFAKDGQQEEA